MALKCLKCSGSVFEEKNLRFSPTVKNKIIEVVVPCNVCKCCNEPAMNAKQMNHLRRAASDRYRELHNLLTSRQIIQYREKLNLSQSTFATYLGVGEASIKRWETYYIQDISQDDHIRLKCDEVYAESNYLNIQWKYTEPNIYTGKKRFSFELFKNVTTFISNKIPNCTKSLSKLHFYVDFLHFKRFNKSITGNKYIPLKMGPNPYQFHTLYKILEKPYFPQLDFDTYKTSSLIAFDDHEKQTIEDVCGFYHANGEQVLYNLACKEKGYIETDEDHPISYEYAKDLLIY